MPLNQITQGFLQTYHFLGPRFTVFDALCYVLPLSSFPLKRLFLSYYFWLSEHARIYLIGSPNTHKIFHIFLRCLSLWKKNFYYWFYFFSYFTLHWETLKCSKAFSGELFYGLGFFCLLLDSFFFFHLHLTLLGWFCLLDNFNWDGKIFFMTSSPSGMLSSSFGFSSEGFQFDALMSYFDETGKAKRPLGHQ